MEQLTEVEIQALCLLLLKCLDGANLLDPTTRVLMRAWLKLRKEEKK